MRNTRDIWERNMSIVKGKGMTLMTAAKMRNLESSVI